MERLSKKPAHLPQGARGYAGLSRTVPGLPAGGVHSASWLISLTTEKTSPGERNLLSHEHPILCSQALPSLGLTVHEHLLPLFVKYPFFECCSQFGNI